MSERKPVRLATATTSPPFRMTVEEWARDTGLTVEQVHENIDSLVAKGWLIPLAPDTWILTVPPGDTP
ncbi:hypothetical protein ACIBEF_29220 [Micromonospora sp. NPDC050795]|uniref:hypothetical protein n=1 Tax=Micromonospora sp. NPDC050795 TaxID=3364282 RepID=UPI003788783E